MTAQVCSTPIWLIFKRQFCMPTARSLARAETAIVLAVEVNHCSTSAQYSAGRLSRNCPSASPRLGMRFALSVRSSLVEQTWRRKFPAHPLNRMSCRWMFLEEVEVMPGVFDCLVLIIVD